MPAKYLYYLKFECPKEMLVLNCCICLLILQKKRDIMPYGDFIAQLHDLHELVIVKGICTKVEDLHKFIKKHTSYSNC